jgi:cystathionine beta-lyase
MQNYVAKNIPKMKIINPESTFLVWCDCRELGLSVVN